MGLAGSWLATLCWVIASRRLPLALATQLIVAETVFGLAYEVMFEGRFSSPAEAIGVIMQFACPCSAIAIFSKSAKLAHPDPIPAASFSHQYPFRWSCGKRRP